MFPPHPLYPHTCMYVCAYMGTYAWVCIDMGMCICMDVGEYVRMHAYLAYSPYPPAYAWVRMGLPPYSCMGKGVGVPPFLCGRGLSWLDVEISAYACISLASPTPLYATSLCIKPHPRTTLFGPPSPLSRGPLCMDHPTRFEVCIDSSPSCPTTLGNKGTWAMQGAAYERGKRGGKGLPIIFVM